MKKNYLALLAFLLLVSNQSFSEKAGLKLDDVAGSGDTSIVIKKGAVGSCVQYEIISGQDEVFGEPEYDRTKGYASWKDACAAWKQSMKEMNKGNQIITLNCNTPAASKEAQTMIFKSTGTYKIKVRTQEHN